MAAAPPAWRPLKLPLLLLLLALLCILGFSSSSDVSASRPYPDPDAGVASALLPEDSLAVEDVEEEAVGGSTHQAAVLGRVASSQEWDRTEDRELRSVNDYACTGANNKHDPTADCPPGL